MVAQVVITRADQDRTVEVKVGGRAIVRLPWSPGTGYGWDLAKGDPARLAQLGEAGSEPGPDPMPGAQETRVFVFQAAKPGRVALEFHHRRPWEQDVPPTDVFRVQVEILD